jgi:hypothetical protein
VQPIYRDETNWQVNAACVDYEHPEHFHRPEQNRSHATQRGIRHARAALAICAECPVRSACYDFAQSHADIEGIWGGTLWTYGVRANHRPAQWVHGEKRPAWNRKTVE